jgi:DNA-directed RNA polymerase III subunit RPC3
MIFLIQFCLSRYIELCERLFGEEAGMIINELLIHGYSQMSHIILRLIPKCIANDKRQERESRPVNIIYESLIKSFGHLINNNFIESCPQLDDEDQMEVDNVLKKKPKIPQFIIIQYNCVVIPNIKIDESYRERAQTEQIDSILLEIKKNNINFGDNGSNWTINHRRFFQNSRDEAIIKAFTNQIDNFAGKLVETFLLISNSEIIHDKPTPSTFQSKPVTFNDVIRHGIIKDLQKKFQFESVLINKYISIITQDTYRVIEKIGDFGNGAYYIDFKKASYWLSIAHIESYIRERHGSRSLRLFKVIMEKNQLEQKQIEDFSMMPSKESKELIYNMLNDGLLTLTELSKTADHASANTIYLFHVDVNKIAVRLLANSYKAMYNLMLKRERLNTDNKRLFEKYKKVNAIIETLVTEGADMNEINEIKSTISEDESNKMMSINKYNDK